MLRFRVAVADVDRLYIARRGSFTLLVRPPLMLLEDALAQGLALMTEVEMEVVRAAVPGRPTTTSAYGDLFPTLTCPCTPPPSLRAKDWPACPVHTPDTPAISVVAMAEWIVGGGTGPIAV